jgi:hypothetical protein
MRPISPRAWLQYISVFALLAVLGTFAFWYAWYVRDRREALVGRNLRLVEGFGVHLAKSLSANRRALDKLLDDYTDRTLARVDPPDAPLALRLRALFRDQSFARIQVTPAPPANGEAAGDGPAKGRPPPRGSDMTIAAAPLLELRRRVEGPGPPQIVSVKVDLSQLLKRERANEADGQPVFSDIVLLRPDGQVLAQRDAPGGQLYWLPAPDGHRAEGFERVGTFETRHERAYLFRQVVAVEDLRFLVCGIVPVERFDAVARWLSNSKQLLLGLVILLATLSLPFLRIHFDPDRSVPFRDLAFAGVAGIAAVAVLTLVIIDLPMYRTELVAKTDGELRSLLAELRRRFLAELDTVGGALEAVPPGAIAADCRSHGDLFAQEGFGPLKQRYPYLSEVSLIDRDDQQVTKWSRDRFGSPLRDVGDRPFLRDFRGGRAWTVHGRALIAQHLRSKSRGVKETVVCVGRPGDERRAPAAQGCPASAGPGTLLAATAEMISVNAPLLPRGYEFAIFDHDGDVMYHSVTERSIDENIFEEVDEPRPFRFMTVREPFDTWYRGREYRAALVRLGNTDLTLAVMRDMNGVQAFNRWFIERTAVAGLFLFGLEFVVLLVLWRGSHGDRWWCLPRPGRFGRTVSAFALVAALVAVVLAARKLVPAQALWISVAAALGGILWAWYLLAHFPHAALERRIDARLARVFSAVAVRETIKVTHVGLITVLLVLVSVLPTLAVAELTFRWSLAHELDKEAMHLQREWRGRERDIAEGYGRTGPWLVERRRAESLDLYFSRAFQTAMVATCPRGEEPELSLRASAPFLAAVDAWSRSLAGRAPSALPAYHWRGSFAHVVLCAPRESDAFEVDADVEGAVAKAEVNPELALWGWRRWTMVAVALLLACFWAVGLLESRVARPVAPRPDAPGAAATPPPAPEPAPRPEPLPSSRDYPFHWRWVLALLMLGASVFIYVTQQIGTLAFVTALASILPVVMRITDTVRAVARGERPTE